MGVTLMAVIEQDKEFLQALWEQLCGCEGRVCGDVAEAQESLWGLSCVT